MTDRQAGRGDGHVKWRQRHPNAWSAILAAVAALLAVLVLAVIQRLT